MTTPGGSSNNPSSSNSSTNTGTNTNHVVTNLRPLIPSNCREVGGQAIWILSSCKAGYGVDQLRDDNSDTYWQSDGPQPHLVNILFRKKTAVSHLALYTDIKADESYTPNRISIRIGSHANDLVEATQIELKDSIGWTVVQLKQPTIDGDDVGGNGGSTAANQQQQHSRPVRTFMIQLAVLQNHQNGRDTHVRQIKVFGPGNCRVDTGIGGILQGYGII